MEETVSTACKISFIVSLKGRNDTRNSLCIVKEYASEKKPKLAREMSRNIIRGAGRLSELQKYKPPKWAAPLKDIPKHFVQVSRILRVCVAGIRLEI